MDKMRKKRDKIFGKYLLDSNPRLKHWCDKMMAIRFDPPARMEKTFNNLLKEARKTFNAGKRGPGRKHGIFRKCLKFWSYTDKTLINATHVGVEDLSCIDRPDSHTN